MHHIIEIKENCDSVSVSNEAGARLGAVVIFNRGIAVFRDRIPKRFKFLYEFFLSGIYINTYLIFRDLSCIVCRVIVYEEVNTDYCVMNIIGNISYSSILER